MKGIATRHYTYAPDSNRLTTVGGDAFAYNARGNMVEDRFGRRAYAYDATNRMVEFHKDGQLRATYDYDAHGRRIRKVLVRPDGDGTESVRFVYDTDGRLLSETSRRTDRSAVRARDLVWLGGLPLAQVERRLRPDGSTRRADVLSLHADHLGAPREARDEQGTVIWRWDSDAFGTGENASRDAGVQRDPDGDGTMTEVSLRFPGQYHDRESGLFYNHHRDYDPAQGRYVQSDPIGLGGGVNRYAYVGGDPVNYVDPYGLEQCWYTQAGPDSDGGAGYSVILTNCDGSGGGGTGVGGGHGGGGGGPSGPSGPGFSPGGGGGNTLTLGHEYIAYMPICPAGSNVTDAEAISILRTSIVPRPRGFRHVVPDQGGRYAVIDPTTGIPGGFVNTTINTQNLTGRNVTDQPHIFEGVVDVRLIRNYDGSMTYVAHGTGTASGLLGVVRDFINEQLGPLTFLGMGRDNVIIAGGLNICD